MMGKIERKKSTKKKKIERKNTTPKHNILEKK